MTQYRGQILPLVWLGDGLRERSAMLDMDRHSLIGSSTLSFLVLESEGQSLGLVVNQILDIVEGTMDAEFPSARSGVRHSVVIEDRVTEVLDVSALWFPGGGHESASGCRV